MKRTSKGTTMNLDIICSQTRNAGLLRSLLVCGIISSLFYVATDILGGMLLGDYDSISRFVSELSAIGAPSRPLFVSLYIVHDILVTAFGLGFWALAGRKRALRFAGGFLVGYAVAGFVGLFFPMSPGESAMAFSNVMHQIAIGSTVLLILLSVGVGAIAFGKKFRFYSFVTIMVYLVLGALPFLGAVQAEAGQPIPWIGLVERTMVYGFMLWVAVLAVVLWRLETGSIQLSEATPAETLSKDSM